MAYAAVIALKQTINRLVNYSSKISSIPASTFREILKSPHKGINSLQEILKELQSLISRSSISRSKIRSSQSAIDALNGEIIEAACRLEDALESQLVLSNHFPVSESGEISVGDHDDGENLEKLLMSMQHDVNFFKETVKKMEDDFNRIKQELETNRWQWPKVKEEEDDDAVYIGGNKSNINMVGLSDEFNKIKDKLIHSGSVGLFGMAGIGKTTLARKIFEDPTIRSRFPCCVFVTVGPKYQQKEILLSILAQITTDEDYETPRTNAIGVLRDYFNLYMSKRDHFIVLDDLWRVEDWNFFRKHASDDRSRTRFLVTTRIKEVARRVSHDHCANWLRFMNKQESLYLLQEKVFGQRNQSFPDEKAAEKISETCDGLPLAIIAVADILSKGEKSKPEYWKKIAKKGSRIFLEVDEDMFKVLIPSYNYLSQHLKPYFLYMGVFPPNYHIPTSKLIKLWYAEGILEPNWRQDLELFGRMCLEDLASKSDLLVVRQQRLDTRAIKTCSLHPVYWYLCNKICAKEKFLHVVDINFDSSAQGIETQRRLCIHNNVLFGIEKVHDLMESIESISMARSLLCTGLHHQYPLPRIGFGSRLLRVLDALTIRFYEFPIEVVEQVHLRYLALTYSGKIPSSISKLWKLEYLIVHRHLTIISSEARSDLPIEIWNMQNLRCLQVMGSDLISPNDGDSSALLSNLLTISYMSADSCTKEILNRTPNVKKLGIQIELTPDIGADHHPSHCFDHLVDHLHQLESLKCVVVNPNPTCKVIAFPPFNFPPSIKRLCLSGLGYPWEYMRTIALLPNLQVLKLRSYAFQGPVCRINGFQKLRFLLIEDTDLEYLEFDSYLKSLRDVFIGHCYNLRKISNDFYLEYQIRFNLVDCPLALASIKETQEKYASPGYVHVDVESSWDDKKRKSMTTTLP